MQSHTYSFQSKVWKYPGFAGWHFVSLPKKLSKEIDKLYSDLKRGWGSLPVDATIGQTKWKTSIFPDTKTGVYLLALKADVRKRESINEHDSVQVELIIRGI